jgi:hypothetical protein
MCGESVVLCQAFEAGHITECGFSLKKSKVS